MLIAFAGALYYIPLSISPSYSYDSNYRGFYVITNDSSILTPIDMSFEVDTTENPKLWFDYYYRAHENGTYNFIFLFPFEVAQSLTGLYPSNYTHTPYGTAIWMSRQIEIAGNDRALGYFEINNTFQSGAKGQYDLSFPIIWDYRPNVIVEDLRKDLGLNYNVPQVKLEFTLFISSSYDITQLNPQPSFHDPYYIGGRNQTLKKLVWNFEQLSSLQQQFIISCTDNDEISFLQNCAFGAGILLSIGSSLFVRTLYDKFKERDIQRQSSHKKRE